MCSTLSSLAQHHHSKANLWSYVSLSSFILLTTRRKYVPDDGKLLLYISCIHAVVSKSLWLQQLQEVSINFYSSTTSVSWSFKVRNSVKSSVRTFCILKLFHTTDMMAHYIRHYRCKPQTAAGIGSIVWSAQCGQLSYSNYWKMPSSINPIQYVRLT